MVNKVQHALYGERSKGCGQQGTACSVWRGARGVVNKVQHALYGEGQGVGSIRYSMLCMGRSKGCGQ